MSYAPATAKQIAYIQTLAAQAGIKGDAIKAMMGKRPVKFTQRDASWCIGRLLDQVGRPDDDGGHDA